MGRPLTKKILESHFVRGSMAPGEELFITVDQTLTHDINAVMTYLAFEAVGLERVRTKCSVSYLDHNLLYVNNMTPDDHIYLQSAARKYGVYLSRPGNGICHAVHMARFGKPGALSMGGDSHTPHGGALGMLCIGVGGMDGRGDSDDRPADAFDNAQNSPGFSHGTAEGRRQREGDSPRDAAPRERQGRARQRL